MQQLNPAEISNLIKQRIQDLDVGATAKTEGVIVSVSDGIVQIHGLEEAMYGEMIEFEGNVYGMALNLEQDSVGAVVLGDYLSLQEGQKAYCTGRILEVRRLRPNRGELPRVQSCIHLVLTSPSNTLHNVGAATIYLIS